MEQQLEDIAQETGFISYKEVWDITRKANADNDYRAVVNNIICKWR